MRFVLLCFVHNILFDPVGQLGQVFLKPFFILRLDSQTGLSWTPTVQIGAPKVLCPFLLHEENIGQK